MIIPTDSFKVLLPAFLAFFVGVMIAPPIIRFLNKHKVWKRKSVEKTIDGKDATISSVLHNDEKVKVPRMGGLVVWVSVCFVALTIQVLGFTFPETLFSKLQFISRDQTWLPFFALLIGALLGAIDDLLVTDKLKLFAGKYIGGGLSMKYRLLVVVLVGLFASYWFNVKLGVSSIYVPFVGDVMMSAVLFTILFVLFIVATFSTSVIDGIDGLAGGVMSSVFIAYGIIAYAQEQVNIAAFCFVIVGALYSFLWFNIPPAKFYMSETGMLALTLSITVIAFLTNRILYLFIIGLPLYATSLSVIIQLVSKRYRGKKVFKVAPIHHHFEVNGTPSYAVTMRYWVVSHICALFGVILALVS